MSKSEPVDRAPLGAGVDLSEETPSPLSDQVFLRGNSVIVTEFALTFRRVLALLASTAIVTVVFTQLPIRPGSNRTYLAKKSTGMFLGRWLFGALSLQVLASRSNSPRAARARSNAASAELTDTNACDDIDGTGEGRRPANDMQHGQTRGDVPAKIAIARIAQLWSGPAAASAGPSVA